MYFNRNKVIFLFFYFFYFFLALRIFIIKIGLDKEHKAFETLNDVSFQFEFALLKTFILIENLHFKD